MKGVGTLAEHGNGNGVGVVGSITDLANDLVTLAELQAKLASVDLKEMWMRATVPLAVIAAGLAVLVAALPVAMLGVADLLSRALGIAPGWTMLLTAAVTMSITGLILLLSVKEVGRSLEPLRRSREELARNLAWLRTVLVYSGRSVPRRGL